MRHAVLDPCDQNAEARKKKRENEKPEWDRVDGKGEGKAHALTFQMHQPASRKFFVVCTITLTGGANPSYG